MQHVLQHLAPRWLFLFAAAAVGMAGGCAAGPAPGGDTALAGAGKTDDAEAEPATVEVTILDALPAGGLDGSPAMVTIRAAQDGDDQADPCRLEASAADLFTCRARQFAECSTNPAGRCLATAAGLGHTATLGSVPANVAGDATPFQARLPRGAMRGAPILGLFQALEAYESGELGHWWTEVLPAEGEAWASCLRDFPACWETMRSTFLEGFFAPIHGSYPSVLRSQSTAGSDFVVRDLMGKLTIFSRRDDCGQIPPAPLFLLPYQLRHNLEKFVCCDPDLKRDGNLMCDNTGEVDRWDPDGWLQFLKRTVTEDWSHLQRSWGTSHGAWLVVAFHQRLTRFLDSEKEDSDDPYSLCLCKEVVQQ